MQLKQVFDPILVLHNEPRSMIQIKLHLLLSLTYTHIKLPFQQIFYNFK